MLIVNLGDRRTDWVRDMMDTLFELYNADFDRLEQNVRRLNRKLGAPDANKMWATRFTREQFNDYLAESSPPSEAKRLFVEQLIDGRENLKSSLPKHLLAVLGAPHLDLPSRQQSVA